MKNEIIEAKGQNQNLELVIDFKGNIHNIDFKLGLKIVINNKDIILVKVNQLGMICRKENLINMRNM